MTTHVLDLGTFNFSVLYSCPYLTGVQVNIALGNIDIPCSALDVFLVPLLCE